MEAATISDLDLLMAYRFLYYVKAVSLISDFEYDELESELIETAPEDHPINEPGSSLYESYDHSIRALALYVQMRTEHDPDADDALHLYFQLRYRCKSKQNV